MLWKAKYKLLIIVKNNPEYYVKKMSASRKELASFLGWNQV